jgi:hypothetical protein
MVFAFYIKLGVLIIMVFAFYKGKND